MGLLSFVLAVPHKSVLHGAAAHNFGALHDTFAQREIEARDDIFSAGHVHGRSREERYPRGYKPIERGARLLQPVSTRSRSLTARTHGLYLTCSNAALHLISRLLVSVCNLLS